ncbi:cyclic GMP-AMP synthase-like receptor isoform X1 [Vanessa atalanta]|uniref:cyclic GMP-AMP synthase-like receptor isoform X1 n=1 Tax=Vanessa atalanta TaxID=42275 RepID=UPI001FCD12BF|nr:cyclic GMP-AMP synthase-like receptor isoform X1 [Vanessa atalanta]
MPQKSITKTHAKSKKCEVKFQEINRHYIQMNKNERKENTDIVFSVLKELINIMRRNDKLFDSLRPNLDFLGSYFDGLRVGKPTEYDINIILKFPVNYGKIKLDASNSPHDYTAIIMPPEFRRLAKVPLTVNQGFSKTLLWCNKEYKLSMTKFRSWMQSTVDVAINTLPLEGEMRIIKLNNKHKYKVHTKSSGPANTITIIKGNNDIIDIDLVPTFTFVLPTVPIDSNVDFIKVKSSNIFRYFVVPKPNVDDYNWRLSFPFQERQLLNNRNNLKSTIKLIKHFRDVQGFTQLSSYFIKTLFLWECASNDESYWTKHSLYFLVFNMLKKLRDRLNHHCIKNIWCPSHNVLEKIKPETCENWHNRMCRIIEDIENGCHKNPDVILKYFCKKY